MKLVGTRYEKGFVDDFKDACFKQSDVFRKAMHEVVDQEKNRWGIRNGFKKQTEYKSFCRTCRY